MANCPYIMRDLKSSHFTGQAGLTVNRVVDDFMISSQVSWGRGGITTITPRKGVVLPWKMAPIRLLGYHIGINYGLPNGILILENDL